MRSGKLPYAVAALVIASTCLACTSAETRRCHELMQNAQGIVKNVKSTDLSSVETSLGAVLLAFDACDKAGRTGETEELLKAKNQLSAQVEYLKKRASRQPAKKLTPEQIAELVKKGDPDCPKGQAYRPNNSKDEIKCTGAQVSEYGRARAESYYAGRGYKITKTESPPTLRAEYGAELFVYTYATSNPDDPPRCLAIYPPPGMSWQEAAARATGIPPQKLKPDTPVHTSRGDAPLRIEDSDKTTIVRIGDCEK